jgi:RNA polymerase sigma factor (sigma-70 family)
MIKQRTNREWIDAFTYGDSDAINDMYAILYRYAHHFVNDMSRMNSFDLHEYAQDVAQDALITINDSLNEYAERSRFASWACAIARNRAITGLRKKAFLHTSLDAIIDLRNAERVLRGLMFTDEQSNSSDLCDSLIESDVLLELDYIIRTDLSDKQRTVLLMSIDDYSDKQIASHLGISVNTVYKIRFDTRAKIVDLIGRG